MKKNIENYLHTLRHNETQILYESPSDLLYIFQGFVLGAQQKRVKKDTVSKEDLLRVFREFKKNRFRMSVSDGQKTHLDEKNLLLRGSILRNTEFVMGVVVYSGHDTKIMMNSKCSKPKRSKLEQQLNK